MHNEDGEMRYVCAAEVTGFGTIPKGLTKATLAPQTYLVFEHNDHITKLDDTYASDLERVVSNQRQDAR